MDEWTRVAEQITDLTCLILTPDVGRRPSGWSLLGRLDEFINVSAAMLVIDDNGAGSAAMDLV